MFQNSLIENKINKWYKQIEVNVELNEITNIINEITNIINEITKYK